MEIEIEMYFYSSGEFIRNFNKRAKTTSFNDERN